MITLYVLEDESEYTSLTWGIQLLFSLQHFSFFFFFNGYERDATIDKGISWTKGDMATS